MEALIMNQSGSNFLNKSFWKICPFLFTGLIATQIIRHKSEDPTYWFIFLPAVIICVFPWSVALSYMLQGSIKRKQLGSSGGNYVPHEAQLFFNKAGKWGMIAVLTWISVFMIIAAIAITSITIERSQSAPVQFKQPDILSKGSSEYSVLNFINYVIHYSFFIGLSSLPVFAIFLIYALIKYAKKGQIKGFWRILPFVSGGLFIIPILLIFVLSWMMTSTLRKEVKNFLGKTSSNTVVRIDGQQVVKPDIIVGELKKTAKLSAHHSHATKRFTIEIANQAETLTLQLGRDSSNPQEYWVFYPSFGHTSKNEIGKIQTTLFDKY